MFTGLKAVNHFGRPDMSSFLKFVQKKHSYVSFFKFVNSIFKNVEKELYNFRIINIYKH